MKVSAKIRRIIGREFFAYPKSVLLAADYASKKMLDGSFDWSAGRVKNSNENSIEKSVVSAIDEGMRLWKWCKVFENTVDRFKWTLKEKLIRSKFIYKNKRSQTCAVLNISERTYDYWLTEIFEAAYRWAVELGLLDDGNGQTDFGNK